MFPKVLKRTCDTYNPIWKMMNKQCYDVSLELKEYLLSDYLLTQFPILSLPDYHENTMALHVNLIMQRMKNENTRKAKKDIEQFLFSCKTYVFADFSNKYNQEYPPDSFTDYFIENYTNRVNILEQQVQIIENDIQTSQEDEYLQNIRQFIRKYIFLNKIEVNNVIINKYCTYFMAHVRLYNQLAQLSKFIEI